MSEYGRFFTSTRHIPMTFGTNPATGERLPGGPYTAVQAFGGLGVGALMWMTVSLWGTGVSIIDLIIGLAAASLATWLLRFAPDDLTDLWVLSIGATKILDAPAGGNYEGKPFRVRRAPKMPAGLAATRPAEATDDTARDDLPATTEEPAAIRRHLGASSVDRLLAHTTTEEIQR